MSGRLGRVIRRQVPVASPLSPSKLALAAVEVLTTRDGAPEALRAYLAARFRADTVLLTGSGTQALQLALAAAATRARRGTPVALPAYSCYDLVSAAVGADVPVLFYDVDPVSLGPEPTSLASALEGGARTLVAASLYGFPLDWTVLRRTCRAAGAVLVEDAAQGLGSGWAGEEGGSFGDLTVLSFGRGKGWTGGSGGALLMRGQAWAEPLDRSASAIEAVGEAPTLQGATDLAASLAQWALGRPALYRLPGFVPGLGLGETRYKAPAAPVRMSGFAAAAALRHADLALRSAARRAGIAETWRELGSTGALPDEITPCRPLAEAVCGWLRYPLVAPDGPGARQVARDGIDFGVARGYPIALPDLPQAGPLLAGAPGAFPGARRLAEALLTLPTHAAVTRTDFRGVTRVLGRARAARAVAG